MSVNGCEFVCHGSEIPILKVLLLSYITIRISKEILDAGSSLLFWAAFSGTLTNLKFNFIFVRDRGFRTAPIRFSPLSNPLNQGCELHNPFEQTKKTRGGGVCFA